MKGILAIIAFVVVAFVGGSYFKTNKAEKLAQAEVEKKRQEGLKARDALEKRKSTAEQSAKLAITNQLKDPASVQYRNISVILDVPVRAMRFGSPEGAQADVVCGEVNAKNSLGGYVGFKWFTWDSEKQSVMLSSSAELGDVVSDLARTNCEKIRNNAAG